MAAFGENPEPDEQRLWELLVNADRWGIRLEMVAGTPVWEAFPGVRHQATIGRLVRGIKPALGDSGCGCHSYQDIYIRFGDGSYKRPDISIYCKEIEEVEGATTAIPDAVVEVLSRGYEAKDLEYGVPFYLAQGIADVVVVNPYSHDISHHTASSSKELRMPCTLSLSCGCTCSF